MKTAGAVRVEVPVYNRQLRPRQRICVLPTSWKTVRRAGLWFARFSVVVLGCSALWAQPTSVTLFPAQVELEGADPGELLLAELNCAACHQAAPAVLARLGQRRSPILIKVGDRVTPQFLRAWIADPIAEKSGTPMPDLLHGMAADKKAETVEALTHYLATLGEGSPIAGASASQFYLQQGRLLYHKVGCVACHGPQEPAASLFPNTPGGAPTDADAAAFILKKLDQESVPLANLDRKYHVSQLADFLRDPLKSRPSGRMPSLNLTEPESRAIAMYLLRAQAPAMQTPGSTLAKVQGLDYEYFEADFGANPSFDSVKPAATGVTDSFDLRLCRRQENVGLRFSGFLRIPAPGNYTLTSTSDDGSQVFVDGKLLVDNGGEHSAVEREGTASLAAGDHALVVTWFNAGGESSLKVTWRGPGLSKQEIPSNALFHLGQPMVPTGDAPFLVDLAKASQGREMFSNLGCVACHQVGVAPPALPSALAAKPLEKCDPGAPGGCLAAQPAAGVPRFQLNDSQRTAIRDALAARGRLALPLTPKEQVNRTLVSLNCLACHARDGFGGPSPSRSDYFTVEGSADLGDEGRIPPHLTGLGGKLRPEWLREVMLNHGVARPYMAVRMPQYGTAAVEPFLTAIPVADPMLTNGPLPAPNANDYKYGRRLVGVGGYSCITCHRFGQFKSLGISVMDLTVVTQRLRPEWFHQYLLDPVALRPGTRMPSFFPEGKAANQDILGGDPSRQIAAIWSYLSKGKDADLPPGLIQGRMELVSSNEALVYRNFIAGAGPRAIGVAYPEKLNLAFDANEMRLALIWQGAFIDAAGHREGRGGEFVPPLGDSLVKLPPGPPFAILSLESMVWPSATGEAASYRWQGYRLDAKRRPTLMYSFSNVRVEDYPVAKNLGLDAQFTRTLRMEAEQPPANLWFRAAVGSQIVAQPTGDFLVDGKLRIGFHLPAGSKPLVRPDGNLQELVVPVTFQGGKSSFEEDLTW